MATKAKSTAKKRVKVGKVATPTKRLSSKDTKKVKGGIISVEAPKTVKIDFKV